jgi:sugar phosphate permease
MTLAGFSFIFWRICEIVTLIPTLGMLAYFVHAYTSSNVLTPDFILVLFITSVLACAWAIATLFAYSRARHSGFFVAVIDLAFVGCFIAGVYLLRGIAKADCVNFTAGGFYFDLGILGYVGRNSDNRWALNADKNCAMLKASFAFGIMNCVFFFLTFVSSCRELRKSCDF